MKIRERKIKSDREREKENGDFNRNDSSKTKWNSIQTFLFFCCWLLVSSEVAQDLFTGVEVEVVAQVVERRAMNLKVPSSNPTDRKLGSRLTT